MKSPVANIVVRYDSSGVYFARAKVGGKLIRRSLKAGTLNVAQLRLAGHNHRHTRFRVRIFFRQLEWQIHRPPAHPLGESRTLLQALQGFHPLFTIKKRVLEMLMPLRQKYDIYDVCHIPFDSHSCEYLH